MYFDQTRMAEAEAMYLRALAGREKAWGPDHKGTLETRYNLTTDGDNNGGEEDNLMRQRRNLHPR